MNPDIRPSWSFSAGQLFSRLVQAGGCQGSTSALLKLNMEEEFFSDMTFPTRGLNRSQGFHSQLPETTPTGVNVRVFEATTKRGRGGSRAGLSRWIDSQVQVGKVVQHLNTVVSCDGEAMLGNFDTGTFEDPSSVGPSFLWPPLKTTRNPARFVRVGGDGVQRYKNAEPSLGPIEKEPVQINWNDPHKVPPGTELDGTQLNAEAVDQDTGDPVSGSFEYDPPAGTILLAGANQELSVTFTPTDTLIYQVTQKTVHINVVSVEFVQKKETQIGIFTSPLALAFDSAVTEGNLLICVVAQSGQPSSFGVTDTQGNTWTEIQSGVGGQRLRAFYTTAGATAPCTVSYTNNTGEFYNVALLEYRNVESEAVPLDSSVTGTEVGFLTYSTGTLTIGQDGDLVLFFYMALNPFFEASASFNTPAGFTLRVDLPTYFDSGESLAVALFVAEDLSVDAGTTNGNTTLNAPGANGKQNKGAAFIDP